MELEEYIVVEELAFGELKVSEANNFSMEVVVLTVG